MRSIRVIVPGRVRIKMNVQSSNGPIIHSVHGECLSKVSDSILVIVCPYDGPAALELTEKTHLLSGNEKKSFLCFWVSRRPGSEDVS